MRLFRLLLAVMVLVLTAPVLHADTTYTYTGNPFTSVTAGGPFSTSDSVTGTLTFSAPLAPNLVDALYDDGSLPIYSFSNGFFTVSTADPGPLPESFVELSTDASGNISAWDIQLSPSDYTSIITTGHVGVGGADSSQFYLGSTTYYASNSNIGTWTSSTTPTPEPSSIALLATGLLTAATTLRRRSQ